MSAIQKIVAFYHSCVRYVSSKWLGQASELNVPIVREITRCFLSEAIDDRVKYLARDDNTKEPQFRLEVLPEYELRMEDAIRLELRQHSNRSPALAVIEKTLNQARLPMQLTDELLESPELLLQVLRTRGAFVSGRLRPYDAQVLFGTLLRAVQQFTLSIVRVDYPSKGQGTEVPANTQRIIRKILRRVDEIARLVQSPIELKSSAKAETELRVSVARARGAACLPLRPIPTSPLEHKDLEDHYVGRPDEDALRLARQIRHADGTILVTGYRGVGKSSFVNRVIFHTLEAQRDLPKDSWLVVPVNVNLAKVSGVQNILRLTLRAVREALLEPDSREPRRIRARENSNLNSVRLPLRLEQEIEPLEEAYIRATYKVTMSRTSGSENKWEAGSSIGLGAGKLVSGVIGVELGKFLEAGVKKTRIQKINRELSLLDYDENAAEQDLAKLIYNLAIPRPLYGDNGGPDLKIKLVFVFDELDKMDVETGLKPMIEGLKNLFLQQYSVFILVTSKKFYYDLLKDRAIEDAMLNSYFSGIVHVPLLSFAQARRMIEDWVDWEATEQLKTPTPAERKLVEQLTRVLVYRSFGNPRDIIRELRLMQEWADTEQPYLTDRLAKSPALQIFAAIQDCVEKTAVPQQTVSPSSPDSDGSVALVSERLVGDEARLEQIRRGLYILTEELINRQTITLEARKQVPPNGGAGEKKTSDDPVTWPKQLEDILGRLTKPVAASAEAPPLGRIQQDNFSLLSVEDVRQLAKRLGGYLSLIHDNPDLFLTKEWGSRRPLFLMPGSDQLRVSNDFYMLTGRQAVSTAEAGDGHAPPSQKKTDDELIAEAENLAGQKGWAAKLAAINIVSQLPSAKVTEALEVFLWDVVANDLEPSHRLAAAERLTSPGLFNPKHPQRVALINTEKDERVLSILIRLLGGAPDDQEVRKLATDKIIQLLKEDAAATVRRISESVAIEALTVLQTVADRDESATVLQWLIRAGDSDLVQTTAVQALTRFAEKFAVNIADQITLDQSVLSFFVRGRVMTAWETLIQQPNRSDSPANTYLRELLRANPLKYASLFVDSDQQLDVEDLLAYIWDASLDQQSDDLARFIFSQLLDAKNGKETTGRTRLINSLRKTAEFQSRMLPYLNRQLATLTESKSLTDDEAGIVHEILKDLEAHPEPLPRKPKLNPLDFFRSGHEFKGSDPSDFSYIPFSKPRNWNQTIGLAAVSAVAFLLALLFYRRDLPEAATFSKMVQSRLVLFFMDAAIAFPVFNAIMNTDKAQSTPANSATSSFTTNTAGIYGGLTPIFFLLFYIHTKYIGPLTFWNQVLQFLVHLPAVTFAYGAFGWARPKPYEYTSLIKE